MNKHITEIVDRIQHGGAITEAEARMLLSINKEADHQALVAGAGEVFRHFHSPIPDVCSLINAKSGDCSENCAFCAQSVHWNSAVEQYDMKTVDEIVERAKQAFQQGTQRFCIVTSGRLVRDDDFARIIQAFQRIGEETELVLDASIGFLNNERLAALKSVGVKRLNHNLEISRDYFSHICTTHTFDDRFAMIQKMKEFGFEVCCGGIIGMGETQQDRVSLALSLKELTVDCVPINILNPRPQTPLENVVPLNPLEIIRTIAVFRLILPQTTIKIAGGREVNLGDYQQQALEAGANGIIMGGYLTTRGNPVEKDLQLLRNAGFSI